MDRRIAIVTGAGSGIGRAVAVGLSGAGYAVMLAGRRADALNETAGLMDHEALVVPTDVTDAEGVRALFDAAVQRFGRVDLLFNNAGINIPARPLHELSPEQIVSIVNVNLIGSALCAREAFRVMSAQEPRGGRIINNGSISAHAPRPLATMYTATKHAITGLTKSLVLDGRAYNVACGQIDIGNAATNMAQKFTAGALQANGTVTPEPVMDVQHVVDAVLYMASLPPEANVPFLTVMATTMPLYGRG